MMSKAMSDLAAFKDDIEAAWETRDTLSPAYQGAYRAAVMGAIDLIDSGRFRVAEKKDDQWITHDWLKRPCCSSSV